MVNQPPKPGMPVRRIQSACAELMRPTAPLSRYAFMAKDSGRARLLKSNIRVFLAFFAAAAMAVISAALSAGGFSQKTLRPALSAWMASGLWNLFGVMTETASSFSDLIMAAMLP